MRETIKNNFKEKNMGMSEEDIQNLTLTLSKNGVDVLEKILTYIKKDIESYIQKILKQVTIISRERDKVYSMIQRVQTGDCDSPIGTFKEELKYINEYLKNIEKSETSIIKIVNNKADKK